MTPIIDKFVIIETMIYESIIFELNSILYWTKCEHLSQESENVDVKKGTLQNLQSAHSGFLTHSDFIEFNSWSNNDISLVFIL